jgi:glucosamine-6-phosphate deaminase
MVFPTGSSQFETLNSLLSENAEWGRVEVFHPDEYIGIPVITRPHFLSNIMIFISSLIIIQPLM